MITRWFGGHVARGGHAATVPQGCQPVDTPPPMTIWTSDGWPPAEVRSVRRGERRIAVFGPCGATVRQLQRLAETGADDGVLTAFAGTYTVVEATPRSVVVFTDLGHAQPIYTASTGSGVLWGSSALALAVLTGAPPDPEWLAAVLLAPDNRTAWAGCSAFTGVVMVPPGCRLDLAPGASPCTRPAWKPERVDVDLTEGAGQLRTALDDAVRVHVAASQRPSADCSGGLDSTSLTLLAAAQLGGANSVDAVTIHPAGAARGGDLDYAAAAVADQPRVRHLLCPLDSHHLPYSRMLALTPPTDEPAPTTITIARAVAEFDLLRERGSDCHLTGDGGDTLLGAHPAYMADLASEVRFGRLVRHAIGWARLRRTSVLPLLATAVRRSPAPPPASASPAWATPAARELATAGGSGTVRTSWPDAGTRVAVESIQAVGRTARADIQVAAHHGIALHNPFTDPQVITACLAVPAWQRCTPFQYKPLLTTAMSGLLPEQIATRRTKGDFTPDHYLGLRANLTALHELADGRLADLGLVDPNALRRSLDHAAAGMPVAFSEFEPVLAAEVWLRAVKATAEAPQRRPTATTTEGTGP